MEEKTLRKRLNETFSRYHIIGIKNPTKETFKWTVALDRNEILNMAPTDNLSEDRMAREGEGSFLPLDGTTKQYTRLVEYTLAPDEKKMVPGEAAYVLIPRLISKGIREKYGSGKVGLSKLNVPSFQDEFLNKIIVGPIVKDVEEVMNEFSSQIESKLEGFNDVKAKQPAGNKSGNTRA